MRGHDGIDRPGTSRRASFTRTLIAVVAVLSLSLSSGAAQANGGRHHHHHRGADATFTKWATTLPADPSTSAGVLMVGVVGGDVGRGRYAGEIIGDDTVSQPASGWGTSPTNSMATGTPSSPTSTSRKTTERRH